MKPPGGMYSPYFVLPAVLELLLMVTGIAVLFHHTGPAKSKDQGNDESFLEEGALGSHEES